MENDIHNFYEQEVIKYVNQLPELKAEKDLNLVADLVCIALNRLPPRYVRHDVDLRFYMSDEESKEIEAKVTAAVKTAMEIVFKNK